MVFGKVVDGMEVVQQVPVISMDAADVAVQIGCSEVAFTLRT